MVMMEATIKARYPKTLKRSELLSRSNPIDSPYLAGPIHEVVTVDFDLLEYEDGRQEERIANLGLEVGSKFYVRLPSGVSPLGLIETMENFEYPHGNADRGKITDQDGKTLIVSSRLLHRIAEDVAPELSLESLAVVLRKAADQVWAEAGDNTSEKILASEVHELAARLTGISVRLMARRSLIE